MRGVFDEEEQRPAHQRRDRELTLGSGTLLAIFFGLVLICGVCFGLGYSVGHRGGQEPDGLAQTAGATPAMAQSDGSKPKPSAMTANSAQAASTDATDATAAANGVAGAPPADGAASATVGQPAVPLGVSANPVQVSPATALTTAVKPAGSLMVQIAAVTDAEDANVLMGALRRRGYAVAGQRDAGDGLIHVRIGPFATRDEAEKWRMKLLNDGYNAILQP